MFPASNFEPLVLVRAVNDAVHSMLLYSLKKKNLVYLIVWEIEFSVGNYFESSKSMQGFNSYAIFTEPTPTLVETVETSTVFFHFHFHFSAVSNTVHRWHCCKNEFPLTI